MGLAQSVASPIADPDVQSSIPIWPHTFVEIDYKLFLWKFSSFHWFMKSCCQLQAKICTLSTGYLLSIKLLMMNVWLGQLTVSTWP